MIDLDNNHSYDKGDPAKVSAVIALCERLLTGISQHVKNCQEIETADDHHGVLTIGFAGANGEVIVELLRDRGVIVSTDSRCSSTERSQILESMDIPYELALGSIRFQITDTNTTSEIDEAVILIADTVAVARQISGWTVRQTS